MKIKSLLLFILIFINTAVIPVSADTETTVTKEFVYASEFLQMLGIADGTGEDGSVYDPDRTVTRGEFASMVVGMLNVSATVTDDIAFDDVDLGMNYGADIYTVLSLGIVSGSADRLFNPDNAITYETAAKMAVSALGYDKLAKAKGGYPTGYLMVANELDILDGVSRDVTYDDAIILISNSLRADVWVIEAITDDDIVYTKLPGRTLLTENFDLTHTHGVAVTSGIYSINEGHDSRKSLMEINDTVYDCSVDAAEKYLGYRLDAWYNDSAEVVAVYPDSSNVSIEISSQDVENYENFTLKTYTDGKEYKYNISKSYSYVKNGRYFEQSDSDFKFQNGTVTLVDNNGDKRYDLVIARDFTYFNVSAVNELDKVVYDTKQPERVISLNDDTLSIIRSYDYKTQTFAEGDFDSISVGRLLEIAQSDDGGLTEITVLSRNTVEGTITEKSDDYVLIDGVKYKVADHFYNIGDKMTIGEKCKFMLSTDGRIVAKTYSKDDMKYGYYLNYSDNANKLDSRPLIKLLNTSNQIVVYELADKVILDSEKIANSDAKIKNKLMISGAPRYQLIKYSVNADGRVHIIDTSVTSSDGVIDTTLEGNNCLTQYITKGSALYKDSGVIAPFGKFAGGAIFSVPENLTLGNVYSDDFFVCTGTGNLSNDDQLTIDIYDYSEYYVPKAAVIYVMKGAAGAVTTPPYNATTYMVESVSASLDRDGSESVKLTLCDTSGYVYYVVSGSIYEELVQTDKVPHKGDIVRVSLDSYGEVNGIARDVIYNSDGSLKINFTDGVHSSVREIFTYATGKLTALGSGAVTIDKDVYGSSGTFTLVNNKMTYSFTRSKVVLYSGEREYVRAINSGDVRTEMIHGAGNEDTIVVCSSYLGAKALFVYRNN